MSSIASRGTYTPAPITSCSSFMFFVNTEYRSEKTSGDGLLIKPASKGSFQKVFQWSG